MKKKKVLFVLPHTFEPFFPKVKEDIKNISTLDHFCTRYIDFMQRHTNDYEFELLVMSSRIKMPVVVKHVKGFNIRVFPVNFKIMLPFEMSTSMLKYIRKLCDDKDAKKNNPENKKIIWHLNSYYFIMSDFLINILKQSGQKIILHHRGGGFTFKNLPYSIYKYGIMNPINVRRVDRILVENKDEMRRLINVYGIDRNKIVYAPNPIEIPRIDKSACESLKKNLIQSYPDYKRIIIYAGRLDKIKHMYATIRYMADFLKNNKDVLLIIIGQGEEKEDILGVIREHYLKNVLILDWIQKQELFNYYYISDLFIHPNNRGEGCPNGVIEAVGAGLPIVGFDIEGVRDLIIEGKNGKLEYSKDVKRFCGIVCKLINNKKLLTKMGENSLKHYAANYDSKKLFELYDSIYKDL